MSKENYINKIKDLPESLRQFIGLIFITLIVILSFSILNGIFGQGDDLVKRMKLEEERIAEEKKLSELISKLTSFNITLATFHFSKFLTFEFHQMK